MALIQVNLDEAEEEIIGLFGLANYCENKKDSIKKIIQFFGHNYREDLLNELRVRGKTNGNTRPESTRQL